MDIEDFSEDQFYEQEPLVIEIPENFFGNLIQLEQPNVFNEFELPQDIWEEDIWEENDVEIEEHPDIFNDPIYRRSDDEMSNEEEEDSAYEGWQSSEEEEDQESEGAAGYLIDYNLINQIDDVWESFILATRSSYLLGNHTREWHWFWRRQIEQQIEERSWDITRGYSEEERP